MKTWEFDVELRVRKTFRVVGPDTEERARVLFGEMLRGDLSPSHFIKWTDGRETYRPVPVEEWIDNDPLIVAVREVSDG